MADRVLRTDFKRIGRSGNTVDGRVVSPQMIDEMATSYKKELFTALMWPEHQRYVNYGTVEELRSAANEEGGRDLFAIISPNAFYLNANQYGQKLFFSMEITADFRKSGKAYLTGLAPTDEPASAATSEMRLSKVADQGGILLSKTIESVEKVFEDTVQLTLFDQLKEIFTQHKTEANDMAENAALQKLSSDVATLKELVMKFKPADNDKPSEDKPDDRFSQLSSEITALKELFTKGLSKSEDADNSKPLTLEEKFTALLEKVDALTEKLSTSSLKDAEAPANTITPEQFKAISDQVAVFGQKLADALKEQPGTPAGEHFNADDDDSKDIV